MSAYGVGWAFSQRGLSPLVKLVLIVLGDIADPTDGPRALPRSSLVTDFVGCDDAELQLALADLVDRGLLQIQGNLFSLPFPASDHANTYERVKRPSFVYFLESDGLIKIGYSIDPVNRVKSIRQNWPNPIRVLKVISGNWCMEQGFHAQFAAHRRNGEWFARHPELVEFIDSLEPAMVFA